MNLIVMRKWFSDKSTIGELSIGNQFICYTLEDVVRPVGSPKIENQTAIPEGTYPINITLSERFNKYMFKVENVEGFEGVRIHAGNTSADTSGCLLVALVRSTDEVLQSREALKRLWLKVLTRIIEIPEEKHTLTIINNGKH